MLCFLWVMDCVASPPIGENPQFTHLMLEQGETIGEVRSIVQDNLGFIWFAGKNGLSRYDGYRYHTYRVSTENPSGISNNNISFAHQDSYGELWFSTEGGGVMRYQRDTDSFRIYRRNIESGEGLPSDGIFTIFEDSDNTLWVGTYDGPAFYDREADEFVAVLSDTAIAKEQILDIEQVSADEFLFATLNGGVFFWQRQSDSLTQYKVSPDGENGLRSNNFFSLKVDADRNIWVGGNEGMYQFIPSRHEFVPIDFSDVIYSASTLQITDIFQDSSGTLWLSTDGSGLIYILPDGQKGMYAPKPNVANSLSSYTIRTVAEDNNGDLWIGAFPRGVNFYNKNNSYFNTYRNFAKSDSGVFVNTIWGMAEDARGNVWMGTDGAGLVYFDRQSHTLTEIVDGINVNDLINFRKVLYVYIDSRDFLWVGSWGQGLARLDLKSKSVKHYLPEPNDPKSLLSPNIWGVYEDSEGNLWIASSEGKGINRYNYAQDNFDSFIHDPNDITTPSNINSWDVYEHRMGGIWIGTNNGINVYDYQSNSFEHLYHSPENPEMISDTWVTNFYEDSRGKFWIATGGGGFNLFDPVEKKVIKNYRTSDGLANDSVFGILEDSQQKLWLSTHGGLSHFDPDTDSFTTYTSNSWLQGEQFNINSSLKLSSGELIFGGINGFTIFDPSSVSKNPYVPPVFITEMRVFDRAVSPLTKDSPLNKDILHAEQATLKPGQSIFSFHFTALNYRAYEDNQYMYRLRGFDKEWIGPVSYNQVVYTNLDAGDYVFEVKGSNNAGIWNNQISKIQVKVLPPLWASWWAYTLYALIILGTIFWYVYSSRKIIEYQKMSMQNLKQIDRLKDEFVASTSHELRTPLFGIIGLAETFLLETKQKLSDGERQNIEMIVLSGKRLIAQVNDILDFSKIRDNSLTINLKPIDLYEISQLVIGLTEPLLINKNIRIVNNIESGLPAVLADDHRLQQILINLISNAFKFTESGTVSIDAIVETDRAIISVRDSGRGIPEEKFDELFQEFTQLEDVDTRLQGGTGLGLSITKKLVELQGGNIWVQSAIGIGSTFNFSLPLTEETAHRATVAQHMYLRTEGLFKKSDDAHTLLETEPVSWEGRFHILIVDDESVNRMVLKAYLKDAGYYLAEAESGEAALEYIAGHNVDLVILDVMMPGLSGYQVCEIIRKTYSAQKLPVVFASARSQQEAFDRGYEVGGNDFLDKPIDRKEFNRRIATHLKILQLYRSMGRKDDDVVAELKASYGVKKELDIDSVNQPRVKSIQ